MTQVSPKLFKALLFVLPLVLIAGLFKAIPHLPNFSPELVFTALIGASFSRRAQLLLVLLMLVVCDLLYSLTSPYPVFGSWTVITYSGFLLIGLSASWTRFNPKRWSFVGYSVSAALAFWIWTNFFVWLTIGIYPKTLTGLLACFVAALPFLAYSLFSATFWSVVCRYFYNLPALRASLQQARL